eukprot:Protomagalhaensia_sp_Gyna_25__5185@NODE_618_length_2997_cov_8_486477_g479_i0_p2_GENE_NODE_618_length_2997_cov_8_486477_g479_i0NODE_618_length_2997_cov_8_486477_g479_i0_p2_ORF_typecomplete_len263_score42_01Dmrt1/PF12374_8/2_6Dmrt1/PF12374_8/1_4e03Dmrt1/PF12374_8/9_7e02_NODE_618_length_2997_cov_8_486477_g479_i04891277
MTRSFETILKSHSLKEQVLKRNSNSGDLLYGETTNSLEASPTRNKRSQSMSGNGIKWSDALISRAAGLERVRSAVLSRITAETVSRKELMGTVSELLTAATGELKGCLTYCDFELLLSALSAALSNSSESTATKRRNLLATGGSIKARGRRALAARARLDRLVAETETVTAKDSNLYRKCRETRAFIATAAFLDASLCEALELELTKNRRHLSIMKPMPSSTTSTTTTISSTTDNHSPFLLSTTTVPPGYLPTATVKRAARL